MRWVEIINVIITDEGFTLVIKDGELTGLKHFSVPFCKGVDVNNYDELQQLCIDILEYSDTLIHDNPSYAQLTRDCISVILDNMGVGSWVRDEFYFKVHELI